VKGPKNGKGEKKEIMSSPWGYIKAKMAAKRGMKNKKRGPYAKK